ncbi:MAG: fibronectin type III domain-containing protein [Desulfuromonadales bacterium]|nr:fibronectin type III domain-containing protein [Desulfuromonadales bacterium]
MYPGLFFNIFCASVIFVLSQSICFASTVVLQWDPSTGSSGYKVYYQQDSSTQPFKGTGATQGASPINVSNQTSASISGLDPAHSYYFAVTAYDASGVESAYSNIAFVPALVSNVSVTINGSGSGNVNSNPSAIACSSGTCTAQVDNGSSITLFATPSDTSSSLSLFSSWSGCTSTSGSSCTVDINATTAITATFSTLKPVHIAGGGTYYSTLQTAYTSAVNNSNIQVQAITLTGGITTSSTKTIKITGGYNADYSSRSGYSVIKGTLAVAKGAVVADNLVIQ